MWYVQKKVSAINIFRKEPAVIWRKGRIFQAKGKGTGTARFSVWLKYVCVSRDDETKVDTEARS